MNETELQATGKEPRYQSMEGKGLIFTFSPKCCNTRKKNTGEKNLNKTKNPKPAGFLVKLPCEHILATFSHVFTEFPSLLKGLQLRQCPQSPLPTRTRFKAVCQIQKVTQAKGILCQSCSMHKDVCQDDGITQDGGDSRPRCARRILGTEQVCCCSSVTIQGTNTLLDTRHEIQSCGILVLLISTPPDPRHLICTWRTHLNHLALSWYGSNRRPPKV